MNEKKYTVKSFVMPENGAIGIHGFSTAYEENVSPEEYARKCEIKAMESNGSKSAYALNVTVTKHNTDGSYQRDDRGSIVKEVVWKPNLK